MVIPCKGLSIKIFLNFFLSDRQFFLTVIHIQLTPFSHWKPTPRDRGGVGGRGAEVLGTGIQQPSWIYLGKLEFRLSV